MIPANFPPREEIARLTARALLEIKAVHFNAEVPFTLASGLPSPTYIDCRKLISYPRTDSRHLSRTVAAGLPAVVRAVAPQYPNLVAPGTGERPLGPRFVDDTKITDHHAIIPTATSPAKTNLSEEERRLYDLICRRLLMAWHDDYLTDVTTVITTITNADIVDHFHSAGTLVRQMGWKVLDVVTEDRKSTRLNSSHT